jgi:uncharacterized membrane protein YiaA
MIEFYLEFARSKIDDWAAKYKYKMEPKRKSMLVAAVFAINIFAFNQLVFNPGHELMGSSFVIAILVFVSLSAYLVKKKRMRVADTNRNLKLWGNIFRFHLLITLIGYIFSIWHYLT